MGDIIELEYGGVREWASHSGHLPATLQEGILRYLDKGIPPGHFLTAVITNNLFDAVSHADKNSLEALPDIVKFFYNHTPSSCWGSEEKMLKWQRSATGGLSHV